MGWSQVFIDHDAPDQAIWTLAKSLNRAKWNGTNLTGHTITKGSNQVAALTQGTVNPNILYMLQDGQVFISTDRGDSFGSGISTPFSKTNGGWTEGDIGSGVVLPGNDDWVLFAGPSNNGIGSILSKDGGNTWIDVTGNFPSGPDAQTGGMVATPDGQFIFAGTDIGPYVFDVNQEQWYSIAQDIGFFNSMDVDYISSINTVRFSTWGSGILDFSIENLVGIDQNSLTHQLDLYPNPAKNYVLIKLDSPDINEVTVDVIDLKGQKILSNKHTFSNNNTTLKLNTSLIASGVYFVKITTNQQGIKTQKLVIN